MTLTEYESDIVVARAEQILTGRGYGPIEFGASVKPGYIRATAYNKEQQRAEAIGTTRAIAAQQLVRTITRP